MKVTYSNDTPNGPAIKKFQSGDILEFFCINGEAESKAIRTFQNGVIEEFTFKKNIKQGPAIRTHPNGRLENFNYLNGKIDRRQPYGNLIKIIITNFQ